jgi:hypothetical protein
MVTADIRYHIIGRNPGSTVIASFGNLIIDHLKIIYHQFASLQKHSAALNAIQPGPGAGKIIKSYIGTGPRA